MSTPPPAAPASEPILFRLLRSLAAIALALALAAITGLVVVGCLPAVRAAFEPMFSGDRGIPKLAVTLAFLFIVSVPLALLYVAARKRWLTWLALAAGWLVVLPILAWLAADDAAIRQPLSIDEFSPAFPGAEKSFAVLMRYSRQATSPAARAFAQVKLAVPLFNAQPQDPGPWVEFVTGHRAELEADWITLAPQRQWLDELSAFDRIGDLASGDLEADMLDFRLWRTLTYHVCAIATLRALDGRGDDAMAALLPLLDVSRKLQPSSRNLLRSVIAEVIERTTLQTAGIVLDHAAVSAETRRRLGAVLASEDAAALARRLIMVDYVRYSPHYLTMKFGDAMAPESGPLSLLRRPLNLASRLFLNPNATMNLYGDHVRELADLAEKRELGKLVVRHQGFGNDLMRKPHLKNLAGRLLINLSVPSFDKLMEAHWKTADLRAKLRERLAASH